MDFISTFAKDSVSENFFSVMFTVKELNSIGFVCDDSIAEELYIGSSEFERMFELLSDPLYLADFFESNNVFFKDSFWRGVDLDKFVGDIIKSVHIIYDKLKNASLSNNLDHLFEPLSLMETNKNLAKHKMKSREINSVNAIRVYAVKIDDNHYCMTGFAIKITEKMQDSPNTLLELNKLELVRKELNRNGIVDKYGFIDFILE